ncbi:MAG: carbohydrate kinase family protein [Actinobacteria bacterium]|nr:carbohydrate kinase family protein [Actinomycetota bacterium]
MGAARPRGDVVVAGHLCVDLIPSLSGVPTITPGQLTDVGPLTVRAGGCVGNTGLDLAALGAPVRLAGAVGGDDLGRLLLELLDRPNVDASGVRVVASPTSYSVVVQPPRDDRAFWHHVGANEAFDVSAVDLDGADLLHVGYPSALPSLYADGGDSLCRVLAEASRRGITTCVDLATFDADSGASAVDWPRLIDGVVRHVDVLTASLDDLHCAFGGSPADPVSWAADLIGAGAAAVLLKADADGLYLVTADDRRLSRAGERLRRTAGAWAGQDLWAPSIDVDLVSTAGAGDAAVAGFLYGLSCDLPPHEALCAASMAAAARISSHNRLPAWADVADRFSAASAVVSPTTWPPPGSTRLSTMPALS